MGERLQLCVCVYVCVCVWVRACVHACSHARRRHLQLPGSVLDSERTHSIAREHIL